MNRKHLVRWALIAMGIGVLGALLCQWLAPDQLIGFLIVSLLWNAVSAALIHLVNRRIRTLSDQLMRVYSSRMSIDIREQQEGALSILKNDIYKLVRTFYEQRERSARDRLFLANTLNDISHQLKTPLTSMQMMGELLAQPLPDEKRQEFSGILLRQLERLQWLVTSLLKLSRLDACAITFQKQRIDVHSWILEALEPIQELLREKALQVHIDAGDCQIETDPRWSKEALLNILKNAAEHTPPKGTITIAARHRSFSPCPSPTAGRAWTWRIRPMSLNAFTAGRTPLRIRSASAWRWPRRSSMPSRPRSRCTAHRAKAPALRSSFRSFQRRPHENTAPHPKACRRLPSFLRRMTDLSSSCHAGVICRCDDTDRR